MKNFLCYIMLLSFLSVAYTNSAFSQEDEEGFDVSDPLNSQSSIAAGLGYTNIGGENFIGMRIQPELALGKLGFGLDVPIMFNVSSGKLRTEEYKNGVGVLRMIRYLRWGVKKKDPVYVRVGDISGSYLGYGMLMNNYSNAVSFEKRKVGITWDILVKNFIGIEGIYSDLDFSSLNLLGIRPYIKPFGMTRIPILKSMDIGFSYVTDKDNTVLETEDEDGDIKRIEKRYVNDGITAYAIDMGVKIINTSILHLAFYAQYGNLNDIDSDALKTKVKTEYNIENFKPGDGFSVGFDFKLKFLGDVLRLDARLERLWYTNYFTPQFFDANYEADKDGKILSLANIEKKQGIYGSLSFHVINKIRITGNLMLPDEVGLKSPASVGLELDASRLIEKFVVKGQYFKGGLTDLSDAFKFDERSVATVRVAYKVNKFLVAGLDYRWTWSVMEDGEYKADNYISPYIGFSFPLNFGSGGDSQD